ncbi:MFS transporter, partial [Pseudomonadales bacterium]|nr:MFS transporter [Pseudomonadales bacterium]
VAIGFLNGTIMALSIPARTALIPEIVGEQRIFNAMAFNTAAWNLSRILGPALAGFMIAQLADGDTTSTYGVGWVYVVISILYFFSGASVLLIKHAGNPTDAPRKSPFQDTLEGLRYVVRSPIVGGLILLSILPFLFGLSINTLLPAFNTDVLLAGPDTLGLLMTGMGLGAIVGSLLLAKLSGLRHKGYWLILTNVLWGGLGCLLRRLKHLHHGIPHHLLHGFRLCDQHVNEPKPCSTSSRSAHARQDHEYRSYVTRLNADRHSTHWLHRRALWCSNRPHNQRLYPCADNAHGRPEIKSGLGDRHRLPGNRALMPNRT